MCVFNQYQAIMQERQQAKMQAVFEYFQEGVQIGDVAAGFPEEDCLQSILDNLSVLAKRMRGDTKAELLAIIQTVEDKQLELARAAEYGNQELTALEATLSKIEAQL